VEVWRHTTRVGEIGPRVRARPAHALAARPTRPTRVEVAPHHPIADAQRRASRVAADSLAELMDGARHLVPEDLRVGPPEPLHVEFAPPLVQVRPTHVGDGHLDHDAARIGLTHRVFLDLHRLAWTVEGGHPSRWHGRPSYPT